MKRNLLILVIILLIGFIVNSCDDNNVSTNLCKCPNGTEHEWNDTCCSGNCNCTFKPHPCENRELGIGEEPCGFYECSCVIKNYGELYEDSDIYIYRIGNINNYTSGVIKNNQNEPQECKFQDYFPSHTHTICADCNVCFNIGLCINCSSIKVKTAYKEIQTMGFIMDGLINEINIFSITEITSTYFYRKEGEKLILGFRSDCSSIDMMMTFISIADYEILPTFEWAREDEKPIAYPLPVNIWIDGNIIDEKEQWYMFTATTKKIYIHLNYTGIAYADLQVFNDLGNTIGNRQILSSGTGNVRPNDAGSFYIELIIGEKYYIRVQQPPNYPNIKGLYRIAITEIPESPNLVTLPTDNVITLNENIWIDGIVPQWYKFTATSDKQYIHSFSGTGAIRVQIYGSNGGTIGNFVAGSGLIGSWEIETGKVYYINVFDYSGSFKIAFNDSTSPPSITLPTEDVITLVTNNWTDVSGKWFKYTANATTQYIHFNFLIGTSIFVTIYDNIGNLTISRKLVRVNTPLFSSEFTNGSDYFIFIEGEGNQIAFNTSETPPAISLPIDNINILMENVWIENSGGAYSKRWFSFTATSNIQYIHIDGMYPGVWSAFSLYNNNGEKIGITEYISSSNIRFFRSINIGQEYYIKIDDIYGLTYKILFNNSETSPALE